MTVYLRDQQSVKVLAIASKTSLETAFNTVCITRNSIRLQETRASIDRTTHLHIIVCAHSTHTCAHTYAHIHTHTHTHRQAGCQSKIIVKQVASKSLTILMHKAASDSSM